MQCITEHLFTVCEMSLRFSVFTVLSYPIHETLDQFLNQAQSSKRNQRLHHSSVVENSVFHLIPNMMNEALQEEFD